MRKQNTKVDSRGKKQKETKETSGSGKSMQIKLPVMVTGALFLMIVIAMLIIIPVRRSMHEKNNAEAQNTEEIAAEADDSAEEDERDQAYQQALLLLQKADDNDVSALSLIGKSEADVSEEETAAMLLYRAALESFETMDGYLDSEACAARCRDGIAAQKELLLKQAWEAAEALLEDGCYSEARRQFEALGEYGDSAEMAKEAIYRKALALCDVIRSYDVRGVFAELSTDPDIQSRVVLAGSNAPAADSPCAQAILSACGKDPVEITGAEAPEENMPTLAESVSRQFESLEGYKDSASCIADIQDATDYTKDFYRLCGEGDLVGALEWLNAWDGQIADREYWQGRLELFAPYCASWSLYSGDKTVVSLTAGRNAPCYDIVTKVVFEDDYPVLYLTAHDGDEEYTISFYSEPDKAFFSNEDSPPYSYYLVINNTGRLSYMMYRENGSLVTSCEFRRK